MNRINVAKPIEFLPVIEVEPYHWSDRQMPDADATPAALLSYFHQCMADAGIEGIDPIHPRSRFVDAISVVESELGLRLIREELEGSGYSESSDGAGRDSDIDVDQVGMLSGGFALLSGREVLLEPACCCDFSNLAEWEQCLAERPTVGTVWIGHPEVQVSFEDGQVFISAGSESEVQPEDGVCYSISEADFRAGLTLATQDRDDVASRLLARVQELVPESSVALLVRDRLMAAR